MWELDTSGYLRDAQARPPSALPSLSGVLPSCDLLVPVPYWPLPVPTYLRPCAEQKCINGSTSCELFYCATATPLA